MRVEVQRLCGGGEEGAWGGPRWVGRIFTDSVRGQRKPSTGTGWTNSAMTSVIGSGCEGVGNTFGQVSNGQSAPPCSLSESSLIFLPSYF